MNEIKFNSQVCTTKEQSQHLLALGLKPETADMYIFGNEVYIGKPNVDGIPAWSLHRLLSIGINGDYMGLWNININIDTVEDLFEQLIKLIEWTVKDGVFNKEYLKQ